MHGIGVGRRVNRNGLDVHRAAGAQNPERYFSAIGDEDFSKHSLTVRTG